jgi:hypothetical protein
VQWPEVNDDASFAKFNYLTQQRTDGFKPEEEIPWYLDD